METGKPSSGLNPTQSAPGDRLYMETGKPSSGLNPTQSAPCRRQSLTDYTSPGTLLRVATPGDRLHRNRKATP